MHYINEQACYLFLYFNAIKQILKKTSVFDTLIYIYIHEYTCFITIISPTGSVKAIMNRNFFGSFKQRKTTLNVI